MYKVGDKVRIVKKWTKACRTNPFGMMDKYLGRVMTIREIVDDGLDLYYRMEEDTKKGEAWCWFPAAIARIEKEAADE